MRATTVPFQQQAATQCRARSFNILNRLYAFRAAYALTHDPQYLFDHEERTKACRVLDRAARECGTYLP